MMNERIETRATLQYLRMSPRKVRLVADLVRGLDVQSAVAQLEACSRQAAVPLLKLLRSAMANVEHEHQGTSPSLIVDTIFVDDGPSLKRIRPRAFGRAYPITKRTSHVEIVLKEHQEKKLAQISGDKMVKTNGANKSGGQVKKANVSAKKRTESTKKTKSEKN